MFLLLLLMYYEMENLSLQLFKRYCFVSTFNLEIHFKSGK